MNEYGVNMSYPTAKARDDSAATLFLSIRRGLMLIIVALDLFGRQKGWLK